MTEHRYSGCRDGNLPRTPGVSRNICCVKQNGSASADAYVPTRCCYGRGTDCGGMAEGKITRHIYNNTPCISTAGIRAEHLSAAGNRQLPHLQKNTASATGL